MTGPGVPVWGPFLSLPMRKVGERLSRAPKRLDAGANATAYLWLWHWANRNGDGDLMERSYGGWTHLGSNRTASVVLSILPANVETVLDFPEPGVPFSPQWEEGSLGWLTAEWRSPPIVSASFKAWFHLAGPDFVCDEERQKEFQCSVSTRRLSSELGLG